MEEFPTLGEFKEKKVGAVSMFVPEGFSDHNVVAKMREQKIEDSLTAKTEVRSPVCIADGCGKPAAIWVRDIRFFIDEDQILSTEGLSGDLPGFCFKHEKEYTELLVRWAFENDPTMSIGVAPDKWQARYTDGSTMTGIIASHNVVIKDEYSKGT